MHPESSAASTLRIQCVLTSLTHLLPGPQLADTRGYCRALREADSTVSSKQTEFDRVVPLIKKHDQTMHGLADEYDSAMGKSRAVHEDADRLRALAAEDEAARSRLARLIEELMEKLRLAGELALTPECCSCSWVGYGGPA